MTISSLSKSGLGALWLSWSLVHEGVFLHFMCKQALSGKWQVSGILQKSICFEKAFGPVKWFLCTCSSPVSYRGHKLMFRSSICCCENYFDVKHRIIILLGPFSSLEYFNAGYKKKPSPWWDNGLFFFPRSRTLQRCPKLPLVTT